VGVVMVVIAVVVVVVVMVIVVVVVEGVGVTRFDTDQKSSQTVHQLTWLERQPIALLSILSFPLTCEGPSTAPPMEDKD